MPLAVAYSNFRKDLKAYLRKANEDAEPILVTNADPADNVVVMSVADYDSLMETVRVYANPELREKIRRGLEDVRSGNVSAHDLLDDGDGK